MVKCYDHAVACYKMKAFENNLVYKEIISPEYHDSVYLSVNIFFMGFFFLEWGERGLLKKDIHLSYFFTSSWESKWRWKKVIEILTG